MQKHHGNKNQAPHQTNIKQQPPCNDDYSRKTCSWPHLFIHSLNVLPVFHYIVLKNYLFEWFYFLLLIQNGFSVTMPCQSNIVYLRPACQWLDLLKCVPQHHINRDKALSFNVYVYVSPYICSLYIFIFIFYINIRNKCPTWLKVEFSFHLNLTVAIHSLNPLCSLTSALQSKLFTLGLLGVKHFSVPISGNTLKVQVPLQQRWSVCVRWCACAPLFFLHTFCPEKQHFCFAQMQLMCFWKHW